MKRCFFLLITAAMLIGLAACRADGERVTVPDITENTAGNLAKTARVWGFAKFTHYAFLSGDRCWDEELLGLLPLVFGVSKQETNDILYEWFVGLGDSGWELTAERLRDFLDVISDVDELMPLYNRLAGETNIGWTNFHEIVGSYVRGMETDTLAQFIFSGNKPFILLQYVESTFMPNQTWLHDVAYLGAPLSNLLSSFNGIPVFTDSGRINAPVTVNQGSLSFNNMQLLSNMDFSNWQYRLLGLFRVWTTINYFFPYLDLMDYDWNSLIYRYIDEMLAGVCRDSYILTLSRLTSNMRDNYVAFHKHGQP